MMIEETIGNTPLIQVDGIWCKLEMFNPTGSIKDRVAQEMTKRLQWDLDVNARMKRLLRSNNIERTLVEASSGNTGVSVALIAAVLGYRALIYCPAKTSPNKLALMRAYGAVTVTMDIADIETAIARAKKFCEFKPDHVFLNQFENEANVAAMTRMALEIRSKLSMTSSTASPIYNGSWQHIVCGIGTGGTLAGLYGVFPGAQFHTFDCQDGHVEGTSDGVPLPLKPRACNLAIHQCSLDDIKSTQRYLAREFGLFVGHSAAASFFVASEVKRGQIDGTVVAIMADGGWRYL